MPLRPFGQHGHLVTFNRLEFSLVNPAITIYKKSQKITEVNVFIYLPTGCFVKFLLHSSGLYLDYLYIRLLLNSLL